MVVDFDNVVEDEDEVLEEDEEEVAELAFAFGFLAFIFDLSFGWAAVQPLCPQVVPFRLTAIFQPHPLEHRRSGCSHDIALGRVGKIVRVRFNTGKVLC